MLSLSLYYPDYYFFAPQGRFSPCGMFTFSHIVATAVCIVLTVALTLLYKRNVFAPNKRTVFRFSAILLTILEAIKISHSFIYGDLYLDAWFPLSYCGLFIFALWMAGFGNKRIKSIGEAFIAYGCPFAGIAFLIFPTTSLMIFPIWHYFSLYSMFYHSLMVYVGIICLHSEAKFGKKSFINYFCFVISFAIPAVIMNNIFGCNLMNLREPYNIPIQIIQEIYSTSQIVYTLAVIVVYIMIPFFIAIISGKISNNKGF